jgi:signal transduction histidine kinase
VVIGFGHVPDADERPVVVLSLVAAVVMAVLSMPAGRRLGAWARRRVYGDERAPRDAIRAFGGRMTRAVPMDELLMQFVELLKRSLALHAVEVWLDTGGTGVLELSVSLPDRGARRLGVAPTEQRLLARTHSQGRSWISVWLPELLAGRAEDVVVRSVSIAYRGELLGLVVLERPPGSDPITEDEERELVDLARQLGLALHNMGLDSALQASLEALEQRNAQLAASRARLVLAADESRRAIERDLHDGAQQHLVALAVKVGLLEALVRSDPGEAEVVLGELRGEVQATIGALRELAHGIYPPLLRDRGLREALQSAATRAPLPVTVDGHLLQRYPPEVEAALYFCCMEALQNAAKHAGEAEVRVRIGHDEAGLWLEVIDSGRGFEVGSTSTGRGFVNMGDRLGALGGSLSVGSRAGVGTTVRAVLPLDDDEPVPDASDEVPSDQ